MGGGWPGPHAHDVQAAALPGLTIIPAAPSLPTVVRDVIKPGELGQGTCGDLGRQGGQAGGGPAALLRARVRQCRAVKVIACALRWKSKASAGLAGGLAGAACIARGGGGGGGGGGSWRRDCAKCCDDAAGLSERREVGSG
jgi:hypothetical protein